jgi:hypothetical protein
MAAKKKKTRGAVSKARAVKAAKRGKAPAKKAAARGTKRPSKNAAAKVSAKRASKSRVGDAANSTRSLGVREVPDDKRDEELAEAWTRDIADPHLRYAHGVEASKHGAEVAWPWRLTVWVMEYVRDDQLQVELRHGIVTALRKVPGVTGVAAEDREVWVVAGSPSGAALVSAVAEVVDRFADRTREHVWSR